MKASETVLLIAGRELSTRVRAKSFVISTGVLMLVIVALAVGIKLLNSSSTTQIGVLDGRLGAPVVAAAGAVGEEVETKTVASRAEGEKQVRDGDIEALVLADPLRVVVKEDLGDDLRNAFTGLARQSVLDAELAKAGADPAAVNRAIAGASVQVTSLEGADDNIQQRVILAMVVAVLLYMVVFTSGLAVAQGVVEEKASRVVEILLSSVRPWQLMLGKVLGIGAVGLIQMLALNAAGIGSALATDVFDLSVSALTATSLWSLAWFVVGFAIYAFLFAGLGALVSRQEEIGSVTGPLNIMLLIPYLLSFSLVPADPDGTAVRVLSYVPMFAPVLMPVRAAFGAPAWEQLVALALALVTVVALVWLSGRVYRNAVLRMGSRTKLRDALRA